MLSMVMAYLFIGVVYVWTLLLFSADVEAGWLFRMIFWPVDLGRQIYRQFKEWKSV